MDLSLLGASLLLLLCNPVVLVHSYDFWLCFGAAWIYLLWAGLIYEVILCGLCRNVPIDTPISDQLGLAVAIANVYLCFGLVLLLLECLQDACDELYGFLWEFVASCVEAPSGEEHYTFDHYAVAMQELVGWKCLRLCCIVGWTARYMFWKTFGAWLRGGLCYLAQGESTCATFSSTRL